jgi:hypothetical protein
MDVNFFFNNNEPNDPYNPANISTLERIHSTNENQFAHSFKLLGVHLDEHLTLNHHFSILSNKLTRALFFLRRVQNILPSNALLTLYYSLSHCHLL